MKRQSFFQYLTLIALLVPSNQSALFNGLPLGSQTELFALVIVVLAIGIRIAHSDRTDKPKPNRSSRWAMAIAAGLIVLKLGIFFSAPTSGRYEVCYRAANEVSDAKCLPTFEPHPLLARHSEFFDSRSSDVKKIDFGSRRDGYESLSGSTWRLPFVNSFKYDKGYWNWLDSDRDIEIFPFQVIFRARLSLSPGDKIRVSYVGEGLIGVNQTSKLLPPSYNSASNLEFDVPDGDVEFELAYAFLRTQTYGDSTYKPYAQLRVERVSPESTVSLVPGEAWVLRLLNLLTDGLLLSSLMLLLWWIRAYAKPILLTTGLGLLIYLAGCRFIIPKVAGPELGFLAVTILLVGILLRRWKPLLALGPLLAAGTTQVLSEVRSATGATATLGQVLVRLRGNDQLVYYSFVREMLETGFFRGGENVYYFQPGIRYVFYIQGLLFGESSVLTGIVSNSLIGLGILAVTVGLREKNPMRFLATRVIGVISLAVWWSSSHTTQSAIFGLSEFGTWILLLFAFSLLLTRLSDTKMFLLGLFSSWIIWIRPNQGFAMLGLLLIAVLSYRRQNEGSRQGIIFGVSIFTVSLGLIPIHNIVFGNSPVFLPGGHLGVEKVGLSSVFRIASDQSAQAFFSKQFRALFYVPSFLPELYSTRLAIAFLGFAVSGLLLLSITLKHRTRDKTLAVLLLLLPLLQVAPFARYTLIRYYPIHIIAIHLTFILAILALSALRWDTKENSV
jgi:hypothetical protein